MDPSRAPGRLRLPTSPTARTTSSASTTCATTWSTSRRAIQRAARAATSRSSTRSTSILIDEARTPLDHLRPGPTTTTDVLPAPTRSPREARAPTSDFEVDEKDHTVAPRPSERRRRLAREARPASDEASTTAGNMHAGSHLVDNAPHAPTRCTSATCDYVVQNGEVVIVDEFTGRLMPGRQLVRRPAPGGRGQGRGARSRTRTRRSPRSRCQNFFRLYEKLGGMTGTAMTEANEFWKIYKLDVIAIPPNRGRSGSTIPTSSTGRNGRSGSR